MLVVFGSVTGHPRISAGACKAWTKIQKSRSVRQHAVSSMPQVSILDHARPKSNVPNQDGMVKAHPHVHSAVLELPEPQMVTWQQSKVNNVRGISSRTRGLRTTWAASLFRQLVSGLGFREVMLSLRAAPDQPAGCMSITDKMDCLSRVLGAVSSALQQHQGWQEDCENLLRQR